MFLARAAKGGVNKPADCSAYRPRWRLNPPHPPPPGAKRPPITTNPKHPPPQQTHPPPH